MWFTSRLACCRFNFLKNYSICGGVGLNVFVQKMFYFQFYLKKMIGYRNQSVTFVKSVTPSCSAVCVSCCTSVTFVTVVAASDIFTYNKRKNTDFDINWLKMAFSSRLLNYIIALGHGQ